MIREDSPYEAPKSDLGLEKTDALEVRPVRKWIRFANLLIDYIGMLALVFIVSFLVALIWGDEGIAKIESLSRSIPDFVFGTFLVFVYYLPFEALTGRTLGKLLTRTKIVTENGLKPSFKQVLGRTFARMVPFEPFSFFGSEGRGWHDRWPGIYVVRCR